MIGENTGNDCTGPLPYQHIRRKMVHQESGRASPKLEVREASKCADHEEAEAEIVAQRIRRVWRIADGSEGASLCSLMTEIELTDMVEGIWLLVIYARHTSPLAERWTVCLEMLKLG